MNQQKTDIIPPDRDYHYPYTANGKRESLTNYAYFQKFLEGDYNSYAEFAGDVGVTPGHIRHVASNYNWTQRIEQYEQDKLRQQQEMEEETQRKFFEDTRDWAVQRIQLNMSVAQRLGQQAGLIPDEEGNKKADPTVKTTSIANSLASLDSSLKEVYKVALRSMGLPADITPTYNLIMKEYILDNSTHNQLVVENNNQEYQEFRMKYKALKEQNK